MCNGKRNISLNLKCKDGIEIFKKLCATSDVLIDTYRPGVLEKYGLGPEVLLKENKRLIYARLTGYGQHGLYKNKAGHEINYIAMSGLLAMFSKNNKPLQPPISLVADFAGGSVLCALGILLALSARTKTGVGQIVDASMTEGAAYVASWLYKSRNLPILSDKPGTNILDGGAPFYATYKTKDNKFVAVGALEPKFYQNLLKGLDLSEDVYTQAETQLCMKKFTQVFLTKSQDEWCSIFKDLDACVTPVLDTEMAYTHECNSSRKSFYIDSENIIVPEPAPKLSATPGSSSGKKMLPEGGQHTIDILLELGYSIQNIKKLVKNNIVYTSNKSKL